MSFLKTEAFPRNTSRLTDEQKQFICEWPFDTAFGRAAYLARFKKTVSFSTWRKYSRKLGGGESGKLC